MRRVHETRAGHLSIDSAWAEGFRCCYEDIEHLWDLADKLAQALRKDRACRECGGSGSARVLGEYAGPCTPCEATGLGRGARQALAMYDERRMP